MNRSAPPAISVTISGMLLASLCGAAGCAESEVARPSPIGADGGTDAVTDTGCDADASAPSDASTDVRGHETGVDASDLGGDGSNAVAYRACVLNDAGYQPFGTRQACADDDTLTFGTVLASQTVTRLVRVDNTGRTAFRVSEASLADPNFSIQPLRYAAGDPPTTSPASLPASVEADTAIFFEMTVTGADQPGPFGARAAEIKVDVATDRPETISIPITGEYGRCAAGAADCDGDPSNGCEVDTANDPTHCGSCAKTCVFDNAAAACQQGICAIDSCSSSYADCDGDPSNGCEANLNSLQHCGSCTNTCEFDHGAEQCAAASCTFEGCDNGYGDCDHDLTNGCEANTNTNLSNCGGCGQVCSYTNATSSCVAGTCSFDGCLTGWVDLNDNRADGCEYQCTVQSTTDAPDANGVDANCDGIDGEAARGIFVAATGSNTAPGTIDAPVASIGAALSLARSTSGLDHIYVATGEYDEQVTLADGVSIFGGYDAATGWTRLGGDTSRIFRPATTGPVVAVQGNAIRSSTVMGMVDIATADAPYPGQSTYGVHCTDCPGLSIRNSQITAGNAANGSNGANGQSGFAAFGRGYDGGPGGTGSCNGSGYGRGGYGGTSGCERPGGAGGDGGHEGAHSGQPGGAGVSGITGGMAGSSSAGDGGAGGIGADGAIGANGQGGAGGQVVAGYWTGAAGSSGQRGDHGNGGGGGGGGGGQGGILADDGSGNGGGGGGGGGCAGLGGAGGQAGGSSFGVFLVDSAGAILQNNVIAAGNAGNGGAGGDGGQGSSGGSGLGGGRFCLGQVGGGGAGGDGGDGGDGGHGGGGAGGNAYGVYRQHTTLALPGANAISTGRAGLGGTSSGNDGSDGVSARF